MELNDIDGNPPTGASTSPASTGASTDSPSTGASTSPASTGASTNPDLVRNILFFILFFLIVFSYSNLILAVVFASIVNLLSISIFDPQSKGILDFCIQIEKRITHRLHLLSFRRWLESHIPFHQFVTNTLTLMVTVIVLALTILHPAFANALGNLNDTICLKTSFPWGACNSGLGISTLPDGVRIGLIMDTTYGPFDQSTFNQDERKVEGFIFRENQQACTGQHVTFIVVTMLSRMVEDPQSDAELGVQSLEGAYLAQHHYNATRPALPLCLAIANLGTSYTANKNSTVAQACSGCYSVPQILHQIAQFAHIDSSVRGIVGFPFSQQVKEVLQVIKDNEQSLASLPIISPSASSDDFSNKANFYRIDLPNQNQAAAMAQFFCSRLVAKQSSPSIAILTDPSDPYSGNIAVDFQMNATCLDSAKTFIIPYKNGDDAKIQSAIHQARLDGVNDIFFPGYDQDLDAVEMQIYKEWVGNASSVTIIGGDGINNVNATTHYSYTRVYSANFAQPLSKKETFVQDFLNDGFAPASTAQTPIIAPSDFLMPKDTSLDIDAVQAFINTLQTFSTTKLTQSDFNTALQSISFQGESGAITFQGGKTDTKHISDRIAGSVYITCYDTKHILHLVDSYSTRTDDTSVQEASSLSNVSSCS